MRMFKPKAARAAFAAFAMLCLFASCGSSGKAQATLPMATLSTTTGVAIEAELARSEEQKRVGLMFRTSLEDGRGMLFVYDGDGRLSFWMKDTVLPLSIAFLSSDGTIREIRDMEPRSLDAIVSERSVRHALEAPRGWFARAGLSVGDRFELPTAVSGGK